MTRHLLCSLILFCMCFEIPAQNVAVNGITQSNTPWPKGNRFAAKLFSETGYDIIDGAIHPHIINAKVYTGKPVKTQINSNRFAIVKKK